MRSRLLWAWWSVVSLGFVAFATITLFEIHIELLMGPKPRPDVVRVVGDGPDLWAFTREGTILQGGETRWWVSHDGGQTWAEGRPSDLVAEGAPRVQECTTAACYRLVDGRRIERAPTADPGAWRLEHERPESSVPPDGHRSDWEAERSLAAVEGPAGDAVVVADARGGVLRRGADGAWANHPVGRSWLYEIRWWLVAIAAVGAAFVLLLGDLLIRRSVPERDADWTGRGVGLSS